MSDNAFLIVIDKGFKYNESIVPDYRTKQEGQEEKNCAFDDTAYNKIL